MPTATACPACSARPVHTTVRDHGMGGVDTTLGLTPLGDERWACPMCGQRYQRRVDAAEPPYQFVDYDLYFFEKVDPLPPGPRPVTEGRGAPAPATEPVAEPEPMPVFRCPACRSLDVARNAEKSAYEFTYMECAACGNGELVDWVDREAWVIVVQDQEEARAAAVAREEAAAQQTAALLAAARVAVAARAAAAVEAPPVDEDELGCVMCRGEDPEEAWEAMETEHVRSLVREVHFGVDVKRCFCDQLYVVVFTERVDHADGDDDQTWLAAPVTAAEHARLSAAPAAEMPRLLVACVGPRRFLARTRLSEPPWWRDGGFVILPHD